MGVEMDGARIGERLLAVIDEGRKVATYKLALISALMDAAAEHVDSTGRAPDVLTTRQVAEHVVRLYLPQVRVFVTLDGRERELRQITAKGSAVLGPILALHVAAQNRRCRTFHEIRTHLPDELDNCLDKVEVGFARYPLLRLQTVGRRTDPFLYDVDWDESVTQSRLRRPDGNLIRFQPGAADELLRLAPLVRPLVELHWTRMVAELSGIATEEAKLREHLFGASRVAFPAALRSGLADLHQGRCFYCGRALGRRIEVDHFIPWSRWPNDAIENLVPADVCNNHKRDFLPARRHVEHWAERLDRRGSDLASLASSTSWAAEPDRTLALARSTYAHLPERTPLWLLGSEFADDDPRSLAMLLSSA
ncbi:MAG TPA: HNH endonuclease [Acidimicrobiales bacterium]|nr:HNH endonuclease [Acidimicrobiales bacterium]